MMQSVQMWDMKHHTILEGTPCKVISAPDGYTFLFCQESDMSVSIVCVECGLRVAMGHSKKEVSRKAYRLFRYACCHLRITDYLNYTCAAYNAYLAYIAARKGMQEACPNLILLQPITPMFSPSLLQDT